LAAIVVSFVRVGLRKPNKPLLAIGVLICLVWAVVAVKVAVAPPGQEDTVKEPDRPGPRPPIPGSPLERLRQAWDSEARADWPVAETLGTISNLAYLSPVEASNSYRKLGFAEFMPVVSGSMIGYVIAVEDVTIIVFRGTNAGEVSDWLANLNLLEAATPHGPVHDGFLTAYQSLKPQIVELLTTRKPKRLWLAGHSLGGALAVVAAFDLIDNEKFAVQGVMTFGQPMVAKAQLASHLDNILLGKYAHFVNHSDIVARVPPGYSTCGSLVMFTDNGVLRSKPKRSAYESKASDTLPKTGKQVPPPPPYADIQPVSQQEFEQQKARLRNKPVTKRLPDGTPIYEATWPIIQDHAMDLYLKEIRKLIGVKETLIPQDGAR
jgi:hypothetical protein